ncbi:hypothetical protein AbraIFM66951_004438 [Aspergillus brasiliensis]|uniref:catechol O-methyltransferase n=1 Tax=Aspergillus brasiliensis TaxID=319629 RepID=A0A9W5YZ92_9EURO|nr:hypothetical protein AbraCBS73388_002205 [Aspergillus brasiliensis]GKZ43341.1 hypothetical protein AbraIFM66951_004438 [Aspergillus brasiliensis]
MLFADEKPKVVVELGTYVGYSAIMFADAMRQAAGGSSAGLRLWSLEADPLIASIAMNYIELADLSDIVTVVVGPANDSLKRRSAEGKLTSVDLMFIDHIKDLYVPDLKLSNSSGSFTLVLWCSRIMWCILGRRHTGSLSVGARSMRAGG